MANRKKPGKNRDRGPGGRFAPGNRANPKGRPKGSKNKTTLFVESLLEGEAEELTRALITKAKAGHGTALELVFSRIAPARKDRHISIKLPPLADLVEAHTAVIRYVAAGEITPAEGQMIANLIDMRRKAVESAELEARLAALEARLAAQGAGASI
ncbi:MAG: hypothetical protein F9K29_03370 [Hyphomicrobiaceae bacterium]|nr:MAG: hypothetical protein F9K29_03370 [Hyphomicrobiaceae bacterium]